MTTFLLDRLAHYQRPEGPPAATHGENRSWRGIDPPGRLSRIMDETGPLRRG